ncbi:DNA-3-methyladenine glycosylase family protein [Nitrospira calida]
MQADAAPGLLRDPLRFDHLQQLSPEATETIFDRFLALYPTRRPTPLSVARTPMSVLQTAGLSRQKAGYLKNLAAGFRDGRITPRRLARQSNEEIIASLVSIRGIGRWTTEMFLMFALNRLDVLPVDDLGIRKASNDATDCKACLCRLDFGKSGKSGIPMRPLPAGIYKSMEEPTVLKNRGEVAVIRGRKRRRSVAAKRLPISLGSPPNWLVVWGKNFGHHETQFVAQAPRVGQEHIGETRRRSAKRTDRYAQPHSLYRRPPQPARSAHDSIGC